MVAKFAMLEISVVGDDDGVAVRNCSWICIRRSSKPLVVL